MLSSIQPKKSLGQNFLQDANMIRKIASAIDAPQDATVVEIGAGTGALTQELSTQYANLVAIEIDERAVAYLQQAMPELDLIHQDILNISWAEMAQKYQAPFYIIGNLPYYITSQILFSLLDEFSYIQKAVMMMQLEVAERLTAQPKTKAYGILSVWTQLFAHPKLLFQVSKHVFYPKPEVTSAIVSLEMKHNLDFLADLEIEWLRKVVRTAFNQRRKTLRNSLKILGEVPSVFADKRAEELTPADFVTMAKQMQSS